MSEGVRIPKKKVKKKRKPTQPPTRKLRGFQLGAGLPNITALRSELQDATDVLLGREEPPIDNGVATLHEVSDAYFARASEITMMIHELEAEGKIMRGHPLYKFRTGELRTFTEMCKRAADLGSRRVTIWQEMNAMKRSI